VIASDRVPNGYSAAVSPHLFWTLRDHILFEAHLDFRAGDGTSSLNVEFAQLWYVFDDHFAIGAGKIITPFGFFMEQIHTAWINKLPDEPSVVADHVGLAPTHMIGVQLKGAHRIGDARLTVAQQPADTFDILLIDAFSSDAVPAHLLTVEAVRGYLTKLKPDGVLILHLSNRNLDLLGPAQAVSRAAGGRALIQSYRPSEDPDGSWESAEDAVIIARNGS
jgi:hypothetical protein